MQTADILGAHHIKIGTKITDTDANIKFKITGINKKGFGIEQTSSVKEFKGVSINITYEDLEEGFNTSKFTIEGYGRTDEDKKILHLLLLKLELDHSHVELVKLTAKRDTKRAVKNICKVEKENIAERNRKAKVDLLNTEL